MNRLQTLIAKPEKLVIGLISGTSLDGVDAALVQISGAGLATGLQLRHFCSFPYPEGLRGELLELSTPGRGSVDQLCRMNVLLGEIFADAVLQLLDEAGVSAGEVDLIGSHGQTMHHLPAPVTRYGYALRATLQLAEPAVIARRTGIVTVADFRPADLAAGGEGAPLVPYFDFLRFRSPEKTRVLLNLGGIANLTLLKQNAALEGLIAFDTGPANMVIDSLAQHFFQQDYDRNGAIAASGTVSRELLDELLQHPYFRKSPPKSTGREAFGKAYCDALIAAAPGLSPADLVATATELTIETVWRSYRDFLAAEPLDELIVGGGGAKNQVIMQRLQSRFAPAAVRPSDDFGIPHDAKEAVCFAVLANETIAGNAGNVPVATGAAARVVLGKICL